MSYFRNNRVPEYAAYGGVPTDEAYGRANGGVPFAEAYGKKRNVNDENENRPTLREQLEANWQKIKEREEESTVAEEDEEDEESVAAEEETASDNQTATGADEDFAFGQPSGSSGNDNIDKINDFVKHYNEMHQSISPQLYDGTMTPASQSVSDNGVNENNNTFHTSLTGAATFASANENKVDDKVAIRSEEYPDFSNLNNTALHIGLTAMPGQASLKNLNMDLIKNREIIDTPYSNNVLENDCYQSERFEPFAMQVRQNEGEKDGIIFATPETTGVDQPTKYGISQDTLNNYRNKYPELAISYPASINNLSEEQAMNLICLYYKESRGEAINDPNLAFAHFDSFFNGYKNSVSSWQQALNDINKINMQVDGVAGSELINTFNQYGDDKQILYDKYLEHRLPMVNDNYKKGIAKRTKTYR